MLLLWAAVRLQISTVVKPKLHATSSAILKNGTLNLSVPGILNPCDCKDDDRSGRNCWFRILADEGT